MLWQIVCGQRRTCQNEGTALVFTIPLVGNRTELFTQLRLLVGEADVASDRPLGGPG